MKITTYAQNLHDLNLIKDQGITEVILAHKNFARFGKLSTEEFISLSSRAHEFSLRVLFEWDILMTETTFQEVIQELPDLIKHVDVLRVQDPGALHWAIHHTDRPLQFIAENGNHNARALKEWIAHAPGRMERIILSIELSKAVIEEYVQTLTVPCELLGFGRILLFYTPRSLLSPLAPEKLIQNEEILALGESEESPHKGFPILENRHGTFMFHIKEFCLVEFSTELRDMGLQYFRVDLRWDKMEHLKILKSSIDNYKTEIFDTFKDEYAQDLMRGFYLVNKTDVLFPKLKNHRLQKREGHYLGEVMDAEKGSHLAISLKKDLRKSDKLKILHPKGKEFEVEIFSLRNLSLEDVDIVEAGSVALIQYMNGVWVKSQVFLA